MTLTWNDSAVVPVTGAFEKKKEKKKKELGKAECRAFQVRPSHVAKAAKPR